MQVHQNNLFHSIKALFFLSLICNIICVYVEFSQLVSYHTLLIFHFLRIEPVLIKTQCTKHFAVSCQFI